MADYSSSNKLDFHDVHAKKAAILITIQAVFDVILHFLEVLHQDMRGML